MAKPLNQLAEELFKRGLAAEGLLAKFDGEGRDLAALRELVLAAQALAWEEGVRACATHHDADGVLWEDIDWPPERLTAKLAENPYREEGGE